MAKISEKSMVGQVANIAYAFGYEATIEPENPPLRVLGRFPGRRFIPDLTVKRDNQTVAVALMRHPVLLYDVHLASQTQGKRDAGVILCVPDDSFCYVPKSVREYAGLLNVRLCPLSEVGGAMRELLG